MSTGILIAIAAPLAAVALFMGPPEVFALISLALTVIAVLAGQVAELPLATAGIVAAACFFGGYAAQFVGHAVEKSMPVLVKHPVQANLAAPFFQVVEVFKMFGLRDELFHELQRRIEQERNAQGAEAPAA